MKTPHVIFSYNTDKDVENIKIGLETVKNGRKPDNELMTTIEKYGKNPSFENLKEYVSEKWGGKEDIQKLITSQLQEYWNTIEEKFFIHLADRMQLFSFFNTDIVAGFLSLRYGSGYNNEEDWFAISAHKGTLQNTLTSMHEIMHIFFHKQWWNFCKEQEVPEKNIWDIKEAMTVLLNLWFGNQVIDIDLGYEEHAELRKSIKKWFLESRDFKSTLQKACEYMKFHKEKSPDWIK